MEWEPHRPSAPGTPSSMSSGNSVGSSARMEKTPNFKQLSPSPSVAALSKIPDPELRMKGPDELVRLLRRVEMDYKSLLGEHGNVVKDVNRRLQIFVLETRGLKENVHKFQEDNQELRDLCCFLDDDRQKGRKLAREWQRFGRYTASVMRSEVAVYQEKLKELEERQGELITENMDLKELCLYLDQERLRTTGDRDEGDGSSNGTITGPEDGLSSLPAVETSGSITPTPGSCHGNYPTTPSSAASYIKELELKIQRLEEEKKHMFKRITGGSIDDATISHPSLDGSLDNDSLLNSRQTASAPAAGVSGHLRKSPVASKPEAVVHAMKVLEVHEELEKSATEEDLDAPEKAIVREMCNVVWRKLGDVGDVGNLNESSDSILDPPFLTQSPGNPDQPVTSSPLGPPQPFTGQSQAHSHSLAQPQPQMASTPLASGPVRTVPQHGDNLNQGGLHNDPHLKSMQQSGGDRNPVPRPAVEPQPHYQTGQVNQQQQRQHSPYYLNQQQQQQQHSPGPGLSSAQSSNPLHPRVDEPGPRPVMHNQFLPTSFASAHSNHNQSQRPPPLSLPHYVHNNSGGSGAYSSAKETQQKPPSSPTKSLSDHLPPYSHPSFQHHQQQQQQHPSYQQQQPSSNVAAFAPHRQGGDQRAPLPLPQQQTAPHPGHQHQSAQASQVPHAHRSLSSSSSPNAPLRPQQNQQHHHQQQKQAQDNTVGVGGTAQQPAPVRLLGAPGNRGRPAHAVDKSRDGGGQQRAAPGGPPHPQHQHLANYRQAGPSVAAPHNQLNKARGPDDPLMYEKRGMLSSRDPAPRNPPSSDSNPYGPMAYSQDGLKSSGFRAYPPQPPLLPSQPAPGWGMGPRPTHATDRAALNPGQPPNSQRGNPSAIMPPNSSAPPVQNKGPRGNRFQEQEWRQTYLDDSDTL
ncbi:hypothetical protein EGW08_004056 [Elysia chlorotica]|uniref:Coiled-coil domain-containing protein 85C n=1 Tax=Elysia chlorotica TaxID=188477 RepID=A0A433U2U5_ELYCH|nr:hypothetical protein EGW08_004056 [Elysia chlorotica]